MIRERIGSLVVRAYPRDTRVARGAEMVDTLLDASETRLGFVGGCASLLAAGMNERAHHGARLTAAAVTLLICGTGVVFALVAGSGSAVVAGLPVVIPAAWRQANGQSYLQVSRRDRKCHAPRSTGIRTVKLLESAPAGALTSLVAALRTPTPAAQRVSPARIRTIDRYAQGVYVRYTREGFSNGVSYYMLPAARLGGDDLPTHCYAEQLTLFKGRASRFKAAQRGEAIRWERQMITQQRGLAPGIELLTTGGGGGEGGQNLTLDELRSKQFIGGTSGSNNVSTTVLLVPNSVASVTARYAAQRNPGVVPRALTVTRRVSDNLAVFVFNGAWDPPALTYRSASGAVLASTPHR